MAEQENPANIFAFPDDDDVEPTPTATEFRLVFEASGTVGRGTAPETGEEIKARKEEPK
jgi:hypothetical protein